MKLKLFLLPLTLSLLVASCGSNEETKTEKADPIYCYVFNTDSPIKLAQNNEDYFVNELSFSANDTIKFVDNSLNPYKTIQDISIRNSRYGFSFNDGAFKAAEAGTYSFTVNFSDAGNYVSISKKEIPVNKYTVTFNSNGHGTTPSQINDVVEGNTISKPTDPTADGYTFNGWFKDNACTTEWNFTTDKVNSNITLYAKWSETPVEKYTVTFNTQGHGSAPESVKNVLKGSKINEPDDPETNNFVFCGWFKEAGCQNEWNFTVDVVNSDITLYAKWVDAYTVTFDFNGHGTPITLTKIVKGSTITSPDEPTASGYIFGGWFKEVGCQNEWNFTTDKVNSNITLYAKWSEIPVEKYTVAFDTQGHGVAPTNITGVTKGSTINEPESPSETGFKFMGWYKESSCKNAWRFTVDVVNGNITLYAKWEEVQNRYFVVFSDSEIAYDIEYGYELKLESKTKFTATLTSQYMKPSVIIKIKDLYDNEYSNYDMTTNAFTNYYVKKVTDGLQVVAFGSYSFTFNPENTESGINVTSQKISTYSIFETNMNATYYENFTLSSSSSEEIIYKYNSYRFGTNYNYSIRAILSDKTIVTQKIVFSSKTNTKKFTLNGTSFTYSDKSAFGTERFNLTLKLNVETLELELDFALI